MSKWQEYKTLNKNVRAARRNLRAVESNITKTFETVDWADYGRVEACINHYSKMTMPWFSKNYFENIEFVRKCADFNCHHLCENNGCLYQEKNWDAVAAQFVLDNARQERRAFVRGLFRGRGK
ncbi:MAG: hypothetical protein J5620_01470 [Alphaproteobacteria bacterium]|nr:hypothetical protein [Alphaproteobacteria bacterium]